MPIGREILEQRRFSSRLELMHQIVRYKSLKELPGNVMRIVEPTRKVFFSLPTLSMSGLMTSSYDLADKDDRFFLCRTTSPNVITK